VNVLIGCEFSGVVREAFRKQGHNAWSCDLLPADDGSHYHLQKDVLSVLDGATIPPENQLIHYGPNGWRHIHWDLGIFHPPCTHLAVSGAHLFKKKVQVQAEALAFVDKLLSAPIPRIALENPVGVVSTRIRKPDQIIHPYQFGHDASKKTCLWLKGLPKLQTTKLIEGRYACENGHVWGSPTPTHWTPPKCKTCGLFFKRRVWGNQTPSGQNKLGPSADRWKKRSVTYQGIADAMADQWGAVDKQL
jgi:hypothetical protein